MKSSGEISGSSSSGEVMVEGDGGRSFAQAFNFVRESRQGLGAGEIRPMPLSVGSRVPGADKGIRLWRNAHSGVGATRCWQAGAGVLRGKHAITGFGMDSARGGGL